MGVVLLVFDCGGEGKKGRMMKPGLREGVSEGVEDIFVLTNIIVSLEEEGRRRRQKRAKKT